jgi:hypothetical protein
VNIKVNKPLVIGLTVIVATIWFFMFHHSMQRYDKPPKLLTTDIKQLTHGHFLTYDTEDLRYFVIRPVTDEIYVIAAPKREGALFLPDQYWWKPKYPCNDFIFETTNGLVNDQSKFHCRDADTPSEWSPRWQWNARGQHVGSTDGGKIDNLYRINFKRSGDELIFVGLLAD